MYGSEDVSIRTGQQLTGLQEVRERPEMYIGSTGLSGLHNLVYELVDNAVDEALAGYATRVDVTLRPDGGCRVSDNGRGIPVDPHPEYPDKSAAEIVFAMLHAGGRFGGEGYKISGGLHVGASGVNALSRRLELDIERDGGEYQMIFVGGGEPVTGLERVGDSDKTGTTVTFWPDPTIMEEIEFRASTIVERLREMAFLNKGLEIRFRDERADEPTEQIFNFDDGIVDFVLYLNASKEPLFAPVVHVDDSYDNGEVEIALQWNTEFFDGVRSFANGIATTEGGTHEEGFERALTAAVNQYARDIGMIEGKDQVLLGEDIREGLTAIVSVKLRSPHFEGQTNTKLDNPEIRPFVELVTNTQLAKWLEEHPTEARAIVKKSTHAAQARVTALTAREHLAAVLDAAANPLIAYLADAKDAAIGVSSQLNRLFDLLQDLWSPDVAIVWLESRNSFLGGRLPSELIAAGELDPVESAVRAELSGASA